MRLLEATETLAKRLLPLELPGERGGTSAGMREAAVLIVLFERDAECRLLLTARPDTMTHHPSQISLPGGRVESDDASPWHAALRETHEELGIPPQEVHALGRLRTTQIRASSHRVAPFVGWMAHPPALAPAADEVEAVIEARLDALLDPTCVQTTTWLFRDSDWKVVYFQLENQIVWGATARILADLAEMLYASWTDDPPGTVRPLDAQ